jgi:chromosome segregation ATPase
MTEYVARTPLNDLTQPQFVFMVLDMMKNCTMRALAERIMSYVGVNVRLPIDTTNTNFELKRLRQEMWEVKQDVSEVKQQMSEVKQTLAEAAQQQQVYEAAQQQQAAQLDARMSRLEQAMAEQEASRKRDHDAVMASHAAVMAALAAIRGLPSDQGGDGGGPSKKRKDNWA